MPRLVFTAGEVLQAATMNDLSDQSVMVFAGTAARGSAIPSPTEGMVTYLADSDEVEVYDGSVFKAVGPGKILQVVSTTKTDTYSASVAGGAFTANVTGLLATITPSSASSKILVSISLTGARGDFPILATRFMRDSTPIGVGASAGNRLQASFSTSIAQSTAGNVVNLSSSFLDSPSSTSSLTYGVQLASLASTTQTVYVNRSDDDSDLNTRVRTTSTITLMEVAG